MKWWFNALTKEPRTVLLMLALGAVVYIYHDLQDVMRSQTEANLRTVIAIEKLTEEVRVNSVEIAHLQHELATVRKAQTNDRKESENDHRRDTEGH